MTTYEHKPLLYGIWLERERIASFDQYPFAIPAVKHLGRLALHPAVTFFVGDNGTGKSTLLEAIAVAYGFNAEGGSQNFSFSTRATHSPLCEFIRFERSKGRRHGRADGFFLRAESFYNVATEIERLADRDGTQDQEFLERNYGGRSLHEQSHGEAFTSLLLNRFHGNGLYLLDEPESALSPTRQLTMLATMHELIGHGSQFIIATHSPIIMGYPESTIYQFSADAIRPIEYEETEHFKVTRAFLQRREQMLKELL